MELHELLKGLKLNKFQTPLTDDTIGKLPEEVLEQLYECLTRVPFIKNLISIDRPYIQDLPKDSSGRAIIDLTNPPIIENTDYFRKPALFYEKNDTYTLLRPNSNPNSEYRKFWDGEIDKIWNGCVREDGAYITGYHYWFLNYNRMLVNKIIKGTKKADRLEGFPFFFEGINWRFYYIQEAVDQGEHCIELAKRGCAKSYSLSAIMTKNLILGQDSKVRKNVKTFLTAYTKEYLSSSKDGTLSKFEPALDFIREKTPFPRLLLKRKSNEMAWQMGYINSDGILKGSLNQVSAVSAKDDPDKLRGKRGWILYEEMGTFKGLLALYNTTRRSVEDGDIAFATQYLVGTASEEESDFSSAKELLSNPESYRIKALKNVFDYENKGSPSFGFFFPAYVNRAGCYNKDGISDVTKALIEILLTRYKVKYSADPKTLLKVIAEDPITPAEAMLKVRANFFPVPALTERLLQLDSDPAAYSDVSVGNLVFDSGKVKFVPTTDLPLRKYGEITGDRRGAVEIFNMPVKGSNNEVFSGRYILGCDPVDNDSVEGGSLFSVFVLDLFTDSIVAEYTGRHQFAEDNYEIVRLLCLFYNGTCLYESNIKGMFSYFSRFNALNLLANTPEYLKEQQVIKYRAFGNTSKGVRAGEILNNSANCMLRDWLNTPITTVINRNGKSEEVEIPRLYTLKNRALIEELIAYTPEINVDRIRAMGMVMLYREDKLIMCQGKLRNLQGDRKDYIGNDPFFQKNYDKRFSKNISNI